MIELALVGCAHIHTPGFINMLKKRTDVKVKSVWDHHAERAAVRAKDLGAQVVSSLNDIWKDASIPAVIICSETNRHDELVAPATKAKKHLFVEKPLAGTAKDGQAMAKQIEKAGVIFQTGYFMRSDPKMRFIKKLVDEGAFGKITRVRGSNCHSGALGGWFDSKPKDPASDWRWMADPSQSGVGGFGDLGTHLLDILIWLMGDVTSVTGQIDNGTARYKGCDELGEGLLRFKNGAIGTLAASWDDVADPLRLLVSGTEGYAAIIKDQLHLSSKKYKQFDGTSPIRNSEMEAGLPHAFELFLDAVTGKKVPLVTAKEAAYRSTVMEAIYAGARTSQWVKVK
jgi:predicted dehydrogenase